MARWYQEAPRAAPKCRTRRQLTERHLVPNRRGGWPLPSWELEKHVGCKSIVIEVQYASVHVSSILRKTSDQLASIVMCVYLWITQQKRVVLHARGVHTELIIVKYTLDAFFSMKRYDKMIMIYFALIW